MLYKTLLLSSTLLLSGCVERGFELTINQENHIVSAIKTVDTRDKKNNHTQTDINKMNTAIQKEQKKIKNTADTMPTDTKIPVSEKKQNIGIEKEALKKERRLTEAERPKHENKIEAEKTAQNKRHALLKKQSPKNEKRLTISKEEKSELENKIKAEMLAQEEKSKKLKEKEKVALKTKKDAAQKMRQDKVLKEKAAQTRKMTEENKKYLSRTKSLVFQQSKQIYQKFGTSEIHGHVVYMTPTDQEIALTHTKIYLVPKNIKIDYWYENYYLKNKEASTSVNTTVEYINATHLNIEKNFAFYGLATGMYYIIIESSYPSSTAKNKKVYIAKKINVEKYKKIMTVFSKKL